jgi:hypothetical protein
MHGVILGTASCSFSFRPADIRKPTRKKGDPLTTSKADL